MKHLRYAMVALAVATICLPAAAKQVSGGSPQTSAPQIVPKGKVRLVNTEAFAANIGEYRVKLEALNRQFEPRVKEVQSLADRVNALEETIKTQSNVLTPARVAEMTEQLQRLKVEHQRKVEDLQADAKRAQDAALDPINKKLGAFAQAYAERNNIVLLIDLANALESNTVMWYDPRADLTQDFIDEYNKANPVPSGSTPQPPPQKP